jgi:hypothetical protein
MGFEEDYRQGLRDKHWRRPIKAFATGASDDSVSILMKRALCRSWSDVARSRVEASLLNVAERYAVAQGQARALSQRSLFPPQGGRQEVIDDFMAACAPVVREEENSRTIQRMVTLGVEGLEDTLDGFTPATTTTEAASQYLLVAYLRYFIESNMQPAMGIAGEKCNEAPDAVQARLERAIAKIPLARIAVAILAGKGEKLYIRMSRPTVKQLVKKSLLFKG